MAKKAQKKTAQKKTTTARKKKNNVYERIFNVQKKLKTVLKGGNHDHSGYDYSREKDFIAEIKPLMTEERIVVLPNTLSHQKEGEQHTVEVAFTIINADDSTDRTDPIVFWGAGDDKKGSVVGLPIAYTMALKYFLAKTFIAETGNDAEAQQDEENGGKRKNKTGEDAEQALETVKTMVSTSRNIDGLIEYAETKLPTSKKFNQKQKEEIKQLINSRVDQLTTEQEGGNQG